MMMKKSYLHSNLVIFKSIRSVIFLTLSFIFTFQSGDIQIKSYSDMLPLLNSFTFQSGDIQMTILNAIKTLWEKIYIPIW